MSSQDIFPFKIRPARPADEKLAAHVLYLSMGRLADYLFEKAQHDVLEIFIRLFVMDGSRFSWTTCDVVESNGEGVGLMASFPGRELARREYAVGKGLLKICGLITIIRLAFRMLPLANSMETLVDEYYIANIGVLPEKQGLGAGTRLLAHAEEKARRAGLPKCSLVVDVENASARRLYEKVGYNTVYTHIYPGRLGDNHASYHRMVKVLG